MPVISGFLLNLSSAHERWRLNIMADNYLERKYDEYIARKASAEKARKLAWKKRMDAYRKKMEGEINIVHEPLEKKFSTVVNGHEAHVSYRIEDGGLDIRHTIVPDEIAGRGIAAALVKTAYDYALAQGLRCVATCRYAAIWLDRHPDYHGTKSSDWCADGSCAL